MKNIKHHSSMSPSRLLALGDAIFAICMTLLVLSINTPEIKEGFNVGKYLIDQWPNFWNFVVSFLLLSFYWLNYNQQLNHIVKTNGIFIVLNILLFLLVVLVPFSTSLYNDYPTDFSSALFFNINSLLIISLLTFIWVYAYNNKLTSDENKKHIQNIKSKIIYLPLIPLLALIIGLFQASISNIVYFLLIFTLYSNKKQK